MRTIMLGLTVRGAVLLIPAALLVLFALLSSGCSKSPQQDQSGADDRTPRAGDYRHKASDPGQHGGHDPSTQGQHGDVATRTKLIVRTEPAQPEARSPTKLTLQIQDRTGAPLTRFDVTHEELVHLIIVRDGLDEFAHVHPEVNASGEMTQDYTFPKAGTYQLFADHKPLGKSPALAVAKVGVKGADEPAPALVVNAPGEVAVGDIKAHISVHADEKGSTIAFHLLDAAGEDSTDLQRYLGAMGHLIVISADGREYVHAHPIGGATEAPDGIVKFAVHFPRPGIYKAWGQFRRNDTVFTVPTVLEHMGQIGINGGGEGHHKSGHGRH